MARFIAYHRCSTAQQGRSGLGLDAQRSACEALASSRRGVIVATFVEVESGKRNDRPQLAAALEECSLTGAVLLVAKLDRLARNAAFLLTLRDSGVRFVCADMPDANDLTVGIMALVAQQEGEAISRRTRDALTAAKARGVHLGNPEGAAALRRAGTIGNHKAAAAGLQASADSFAEKVRRRVEVLRAKGITTLGGIAHALNEANVLTPQGKTWHRSSVRNLLQRLAA